MRVEGLETLDYLDNLQNRERFTEQGDALTFEDEVFDFFIFELSLKNLAGDASMYELFLGLLCLCCRWIRFI